MDILLLVTRPNAKRDVTDDSKAYQTEISKSVYPNNCDFPCWLQPLVSTDTDAKQYTPKILAKCLSEAGTNRVYFSFFVYQYKIYTDNIAIKTSQIYDHQRLKSMCVHIYLVYIYMLVSYDCFVYTFRYFILYIDINGHVRCKLNINLVTNIAFLTTEMNAISSKEIFATSGIRNQKHS